MPGRSLFRLQGHVAGTDVLFKPGSTVCLNYLSLLSSLAILLDIPDLRLFSRSFTLFLLAFLSLDRLVRLPSFRRMLTIPFLISLLLVSPISAAPKRKSGVSTKQQTPQQQAAQVPDGISTATDGSTILDTTVTVNGLPLRFKISGPASAFTNESGVTGATAQAGDQGDLGLNVLLHGDGGQSFFDFPNQAVQDGLMGVAILAPSEQLLWGQATGAPAGLSRPDGLDHAQALRDLVKDVLPQVAAFNASNVFFTGVSGGSLTLSGFFVPAFMNEFAGTGVLLMCGGLTPQVDVVGADKFIGNTKIHFQSTQQELALLQPAIPKAVTAYEQLAVNAGLDANAIGQLQTVDNTPNGGHFNGLSANTVLKTVVGNEKLRFGRGQKRDAMGPVISDSGTRLRGGMAMLMPGE
ncbi:hypothetical protein DL546_002836 [Coniochaeta pulveracea]|uniref:Uncharacterized protein n=1 Tax=Coniochaeta pulveracea TaxID=177199 RepID=A0A420XZ46_9PEZI|nr:hypothetical protein DL546_002836 [Coniochaeta pulveracea]